MLKPTPPPPPLQRGKIFKLQVFCAYYAHKSCITFVLLTVKIVSSRLYFYEVFLNFKESPVAMYV